MAKKYLNKPILILVTFILTFGQTFSVLAENTTNSASQISAQTENSNSSTADSTVSLNGDNNGTGVEASGNTVYQQEPNVQQAQNKLPGMTGSFLVDNFSGAATYSYPINIPAGIGGVQPSLGLSYNSHAIGQNGSLVGSGWSLSQSVITRQNKAGTVNLYNSNYYSLQIFGEQMNLVPVDLAQGIFAPEIANDFWQVKYLGAQGWQVSDKNGWVYIFGDSATTRQFDPSNQQNVYSWWLKKVSDPNGNYIEYNYLLDNGQTYLKSINYTKFADQSGKFEIRFQPFYRGLNVTDVRPDIHISYASGYKIETKYRLQNIEIWSNDQKTSQYDLNYITGQNGKTSLLKSLQLVGYDENGQEKRLPKTNFDYTTKQPGYTDVTSQYPVNQWEGFAYMWPNSDRAVGQLDEFNGDSWLDRGASVFNGQKWVAGNLVFPEQINNGQLNDYLNRYSLIGDVNGDGKNDIIYSLSGGVNYNKMWLNAGDHFEPGFSLPPFFYESDHNVPMSKLALVDVNADGLSDIIYAYQQDNAIGSPEIVKDIWLNTGTSFVKGYGQFPVILTRCAINTFWNCTRNLVQFVDVNNDGLADVINGENVYINSGHDFSQLVGSQWGMPSLPSNFGEAWSAGGARFVDLNSDGLVDITINHEAYYLENGSWAFHYYAASYLNTGSGWQRDDSWNVPVVMASSGSQFLGDYGVRIFDLNNDGSFDIVRKLCGDSWCEGSSTNFPHKVWQTLPGKSNLLNKISIENNIVNEIEYQQSTQVVDEQGQWLNNKLPVAITVVKSVKENNGLGQTSQTNYQYAYGHYYVDNQFPNNNQFAGFGVITIDSGDKKIKKFYHQGGGFDGSLLGENTDTVALRGRQYREETYVVNNGQEKLENISLQKWSGQVNGNTSRTYLDSTENFNNGNELAIAQNKSAKIFARATTYYVKPISSSQEQGSIADSRLAKEIYSKALYIPEISNTDTSQYFLGKNEVGYEYLAILGADSYISASTTAEVTADGDICMEKNNNEHWTYLVRGWSGNITADQNNLRVINYSSGPNRKLCRVFLPFDTRSIPKETTQIQEVKLQLYINSVIGEGEAQVSGAEPLNPPVLNEDDYHRFSWTPINEFPLVATTTGRYFVSQYATSSTVVIGGYTSFVLRGPKDRSEAGSLYSHQSEINIASSRTVNPEQRPKLFIKYITQSPLTRATDLKINDLTNPLNTLPPVIFSAKYQSNNLVTTAKDYQIQLIKDDGSFDSPLWDSQKQVVSGVVGVGQVVSGLNYTGPELMTDGTVYKWRIKFWDSNNEEGLWSIESAVFSLRLKATGLGSSYDYNSQTNQIVKEESLGKNIYDIMTGELIETIPGDEQSTDYDYAHSSSTAAPIVSAVKEVEVRAGATEAVVKRQAYYDNLPLGQVNKYNKTKDSLIENGINYRTEYDSRGRITKKIDPKNNEIIITYDTTGVYPKITTNSLGQQIETDYDLATGQIVRQVDSNGAVETKELDAFGRVIMVKKSDPSGNGEMIEMMSVEYNDQSMPRSVKTSTRTGNENWRKNYEYFDGLGRQIQTRNELGTGEYAVVSTLYDNLGRVIKKTLPYANQGGAYQVETWSNPKITYTYDVLNRPLTEVTPVGQTTYAYDGLVTTVTDPNGHQKRYTRDAYDRLVQVEEQNRGEIYLTKYEYNVLGKLIKITDAQNNTREFTYDSLGRLLTQTDMHRPDRSGQVWTYSYDDASNMISKTSANGQTLNYSYDALNRITREWSDDTDINYYYDQSNFGVGRLSRVEASDYSKHFQYNQWGQTTDELVRIKNNEYRTRFEYDNFGRLVVVNYPDEFKAYYTYNNLGQLHSVGQRQSRPSETNQTEQLLVNSYEYNLLGQVTKINYANGLVTEYVYDPAQAYRLTKKTSINSGNERLQNFNYTYDPVGNILALSDYGQTKTSKEVNYTYDDLDRLVTANIRDLVGVNNESQEYKYDAIGNILNKSDIGDYSYGLANPHQAGLIGKDEMTYDPNGNLTRDGKNSYTYDSRDKMVGVVSNDGQKDSMYLYDQSGQRLWKKATEMITGQNLAAPEANSTTTLPLLDSSITPSSTDQVISVSTTQSIITSPTRPESVEIYYPNQYFEVEYISSTTSKDSGTGATNQDQSNYSGEVVLDKSGNQTITHHIYAGSERIAQSITENDKSSLNYILSDHLGSTHLILDEGGKVLSQYDYYPFGSTRIEIDGKDNTKQFTGKIKDTETGLNYFEARYLDSNFGKFTQIDPLLMTDVTSVLLDPQALNEYSYTKNNPVKYIDPDGRATKNPWELYTEKWLQLGKWMVEKGSQFIEYMAAKEEEQVKSYASQYERLSESDKKFYGSAEGYGRYRANLNNMAATVMGPAGEIKGFTGKIASEADIKLLNKTFEALGSQGQKFAQSAYSQFVNVIKSTGKLIHEVSNVRLIKSSGEVAFYEIKHAAGIRVYINKVGEVIGFSNKNNQQKVIDRLINLIK